MRYLKNIRRTLYLSIPFPCQKSVTYSRPQKKSNGESFGLCSQLLFDTSYAQPFPYALVNPTFKFFFFFTQAFLFLQTLRLPHHSLAFFFLISILPYLSSARSRQIELFHFYTSRSLQQQNGFQWVIPSGCHGCFKCLFEEFPLLSRNKKIQIRCGSCLLLN